MPASGRSAAGPSGELPGTAACADAVMTFDDTPRVASGLVGVVSGRQAIGPAHPVIHRGSVDAILEALETLEPGAILFVDDAGRTDRACVGDLIALEARAAGAVAVIVWGCHRDTEGLRAIDLPLFSLGSHPAGPAPGDAADATRRADEPPMLSGLLVERSDHVVADDDGVVLLSDHELARVLAEARRIESREQAQADRMLAGRSLRSQLRFDEFRARRAEDPSFDFREHLRDIGGAIER